MAGLDELIADEQRRLDELLGVNYALALNGDRVSTDFCLAIMRRRCDLAALAPRGGFDAGIDPKAALLARLETIAANLARGGPAWRGDVAGVAAVATVDGDGESPHPSCSA
jgi:hypothetical protein